MSLQKCLESLPQAAGDPKCIVLLYLHRKRQREKAIQSNSHKVQVLPQKFFIPLVNVSNTPKAPNGSLQTNPTWLSTQGQSKHRQGPSDLDEEIVTDFSGALGLVPGKNQICLSEASTGRARWLTSQLLVHISLSLMCFMYMKIQNASNISRHQLKNPSDRASGRLETTFNNSKSRRLQGLQHILNKQFQLVLRRDVLFMGKHAKEWSNNQRSPIRSQRWFDDMMWWRSFQWQQHALKTFIHLHGLQTFIQQARVLFGRHIRRTCQPFAS